MRHFSAGTQWHRYEFGRATVMVKPSAAGVMDGLIRCNFAAQVHPVGGQAVEFSVHAFYPWDAANMALKIYQQQFEK